MDFDDTNKSMINENNYSNHETNLSYIRDIAKILAEYSWIYSVRNTDIFVQHVLEKIPHEWVEAVCDLSVNEYKQLPYGFIKDDWPNSFKTFLLQSTKLADVRFSKCITDLVSVKSKTSSIERNMPLKKQSEIAAMSALVNQICKDVNCHKVLDIGSGLGYIDQFLHHNFGLQCIGLDYKDKRTESAKSRIREDACHLSMHHETMVVENNEECIEKLKVILKNAHNANSNCKCRDANFPEDSFTQSEGASFVMIGLHCCGNLMQDMMKLFCSMKELKAFVGVGCCYNKINLEDFPLSQAGQDAVSSVSEEFPLWYPCISGLRLGSHTTRAGLKDLTQELLLNQEKTLIYRGILQCYIRQESIDWRKPKRRIRVYDLVNFEKYCDIMLQKHEENFTDLQRQERMKKMNEIYSSKEILFPRIRVFLILQMILQPLWEYFVLLDRKFYFQEKSIVAELRAVWDDSVSPRNMALCAYK